MNSPENNVIVLQTTKEITRLYKTCLEILEDLKNDHEIMMKKVAEKNGDEYAKNINFFTQEKYEQIRKRILDNGNESNRQLVNFLEYFDFTINTAKVEESAKQKRTIKKVVINSLVSIT